MPIPEDLLDRMQAHCAHCATVVRAIREERAAETAGLTESQVAFNRHVGRARALRARLQRLAGLGFGREDPQVVAAGTELRETQEAMEPLRHAVEEELGRALTLEELETGIRPRRKEGP